MARELTGAEAVDALLGETVTAVTFTDGYLVMRVGKLTIYADDPAVYGDSDNDADRAVTSAQD